MNPLLIKLILILHIFQFIDCDQSNLDYDFGKFENTMNRDLDLNVPKLNTKINKADRFDNMNQDMFSSFDKLEFMPRNNFKNKMKNKQGRFNMRPQFATMKERDKQGMQTKQEPFEIKDKMGIQAIKEPVFMRKDTLPSEPDIQIPVPPDFSSSNLPPKDDLVIYKHDSIKHPDSKPKDLTALVGSLVEKLGARSKPKRRNRYGEKLSRAQTDKLVLLLLNSSAITSGDNHPPVHQDHLRNVLVRDPNSFKLIPEYDDQISDEKLTELLNKLPEKSNKSIPLENKPGVKFERSGDYIINKKYRNSSRSDPMSDVKIKFVTMDPDSLKTITEQGDDIRVERFTVETSPGTIETSTLKPQVQQRTMVKNKDQDNFNLITESKTEKTKGRVFNRSGIFTSVGGSNKIPKPGVKFERSGDYIINKKYRNSTRSDPMSDVKIKFVTMDPDSLMTITEPGDDIRVERFTIETTPGTIDTSTRIPDDKQSNMVKNKDQDNLITEPVIDSKTERIKGKVFNRSTLYTLVKGSKKNPRIYLAKRKKRKPGLRGQDSNEEIKGEVDSVEYVWIELDSESSDSIKGQVDEVEDNSPLNGMVGDSTRKPKIYRAKRIRKPVPGGQGSNDDIKGEADSVEYVWVEVNDSIKGLVDEIDEDTPPSTQFLVTEQPGAYTNSMTGMVDKFSLSALVEGSTRKPGGYLVKRKRKGIRGQGSNADVKDEADSVEYVWVEMSTESSDSIKGEVDEVEENTPPLAQLALTGRPGDKYKTGMVANRSSPITLVGSSTRKPRGYLAKRIRKKPRHRGKGSNDDIKDEVDSVEYVWVEVSTDSSDSIKGEVDEVEDNIPQSTLQPISTRKLELSTESNTDIKEQVDEVEENTPSAQDIKSSVQYISGKTTIKYEEPTPTSLINVDDLLADVHPIQNPFDELDDVLNSISKEDTFNFANGGKIIYPTNATSNETRPIFEPSPYLKSSDNMTRFKAIVQAAKEFIRTKLTSTSTQRAEYLMSTETTVTTSLEEVSTEFRPELKAMEIPLNFTAIDDMKRRANLTLFKAIALAAKGLINGQMGDALTTSSILTDSQSKGKAVIEELSTETRPQIKTTSNKMKAFKPSEELNTQSIDDIKGEADEVEENSPTPTPTQMRISRVPTVTTTTDRISMKTETLVDTNAKETLIESFVPPARGLITRRKYSTTSTTTPATTQSDVDLKEEADAIEEISTEMRTQLKTTSNKMITIKALEELNTQSIDDIKGEVDEVEENNATPGSAQVMPSPVPRVRTSTERIPVKIEPNIITRGVTDRVLIDNRMESTKIPLNDITIDSTKSQANLTRLRAIALAAQKFIQEQLASTSTIKSELLLNYKTTTFSMNRQSLSTESEVDIKGEVDSMEEVSTETSTQMRTNSYRMTTFKASEGLTIKPIVDIKGQTTQNPFQELDDVLKSISPEDSLKYAQNGKIIFPKNLSNKQTGPIFDPSQYMKSGANMTKFKAIALAAKDFIRAQLTSTSTERTQYFFSDKTTATPLTQLMTTSNRMTTIKTSEELTTQSIDDIKGEADEVEENSPTPTPTQMRISRVPTVTTTTDRISMKTETLVDTNGKETLLESFVPPARGLITRRKYSTTSTTTPATTQSDVDLKEEADSIEEISTSISAQVKTSPVSTLRINLDRMSTKTQPISDTKTTMSLFNNIVQGAKGLIIGQMTTSSTTLPEIWISPKQTATESDIDIKGEADVIEEISTEGKPQLKTTTDQDTMSKGNTTIVQISSTSTTESDDDEEDVMLGVKGSDSTTESNDKLITNKSIRSGAVVPKNRSLKSESLSLNLKKIFGNNETNIDPDDIILQSDQDSINKSIILPNDPGNKTASEVIVLDDVKNIPVNIFGPKDINLLKDLIFLRKNYKFINKDKLYNLLGLRIGEKDWKGGKGALIRDKLKTVYKVNKPGDSKNNLVTEILPSTKLTVNTESDVDIKGEADVIEEISTEGSSQMRDEKSKDNLTIFNALNNTAKGLINEQLSSTSTTIPDDDEEDVMLGKGGNDITTESNQDNLSNIKLNEHVNYTMIDVVSLDDVKNVTANIFGPKENSLLNTMIINRNSQRFVNKDKLYNLLESVIGEKDWKGEKGAMIKDKFKVKYKVQIKRVHFSRTKSNSMAESTTIWTDVSEDYITDSDVDDDNVTKSVQDTLPKKVLNELVNDENYIIEIKRKFNDNRKKVLAFDEIKNITGGLFSANETNTLLNSMNNTNGVNKDDLLKLLDSKIEAKKEIAKMTKDKFRIKIKGNYGIKLPRSKTNRKVNNEIIGSTEDSDSIKDGADFVDDMSLSGNSSKNDLIINEKQLENDTEYTIVKDDQTELGNSSYPRVLTIDDIKNISIGFLNENETNTLLNSINNNTKYVNPDEFYKLLESKIGEKSLKEGNGSMIQDKFKIKFKDFRKRVFRPKFKPKFDKQLFGSIDNNNDIKDEVDVAEEGPPAQNEINSGIKQGNTLNVPDIMKPVEVLGDNGVDEPEYNMTDFLVNSTRLNRTRIRLGGRLLKGAFNASRMFIDPARRTFSKMGSNMQDYLAQRKNDGQDVLLKSFVLSTEQGDNSTEQIEFEEPESSSETSPGSLGWKDRLRSGYKLAKAGAKLALNATKVLSEPAKAKIMDMGSNIKNYIEQRKNDDQDKVLQMKPDEIQSTETVTESRLKTGLANLKNSKLFSFG